MRRDSVKVLNAGSLAAVASGPGPVRKIRKFVLDFDLRFLTIHLTSMFADYWACPVAELGTAVISLIGSKTREITMKTLTWQRFAAL